MISSRPFFILLTLAIYPFYCCLIMAAELPIQSSFSLAVGELLPFEIPEGSEVAVSPKGFIKIQRDAAQGRWMLLGLKPGTASIEVQAADQTSQKRLYHVRVLNHLEVNQRRPTKRGQFPSELCSHPGILCRADLGLITGITNSYEWRTHARNQCHQTKSCQVDVKLTIEESQRMLQVFRERVGPEYEVYLTSGGEISVGILCSGDSKTMARDQVNFLTAGAVERGEIGVDCRKPSPDQRYSVKFRLNLTSDTDAMDRGLVDPRYPNNRSSFLTAPAKSALNWLHDSKTKNTSISLGEPLVIVDLGQKAHLISGSEFVSGTEVDRQTGQLKPHFTNVGLDIKAEILGLHNNFVRTRLVGRMKSQTTRNQNKFAIQEINTEVSLELGNEQVIGSSQLSGDHQLRTNSSILDKIPIIGPLLAYQSSDQAQATVVISVVIERVKL